MKKIEAIIKPFKLDEVKEALQDVGVQGLSVIEVKGFGRQKGQTGVYRGHEFSLNLLRKVQLQIAVNEPERVVVIDTTRSLEEVSADIEALVEQAILQ